MPDRAVPLTAEGALTADAGRSSLVLHPSQLTPGMTKSPIHLLTAIGALALAPLTVSAESVARTWNEELLAAVRENRTLPLGKPTPCRQRAPGPHRLLQRDR